MKHLLNIVIIVIFIFKFSFPVYAFSEVIYKCKLRGMTLNQAVSNITNPNFVVDTSNGTIEEISEYNSTYNVNLILYDCVDYKCSKAKHIIQYIEDDDIIYETKFERKLDSPDGFFQRYISAEEAEYLETKHHELLIEFDHPLAVVMVYSQIFYGKVYTEDLSEMSFNNTTTIQDFSCAGLQ